MKRKALEKLINWKSRGSKKPLLIFGAKNTGKTHLVKEFGNSYFNNIVYINCESNIFASDIFDNNVNFKEILKKLELIFNKSIEKENTLIFFDEIQNNPNALRSLIDYCNGEMEYYVTVSMSLNEDFALKEYNIDKSKVETLTIYPLSFDEFLMNTDNEDLLVKINVSFKNKEPLPGLIHKKAFDLYYDYLIVGGFPEVVDEYLNTDSIINSIDHQKNTIEAFKGIMLKEDEAKKIVATYNSISSQLLKDNKKFQYKLVANGGTSNTFSSSIDFLVNNQMAYKCSKYNISSLDNKEIDDSSFIMYLNDSGLLTNMSEFPIYLIRNREAVNEKMFDMLSVNFLACTLKSNDFDLTYWKNSYDSKLDFILRSKDGLVVPAEVKSDNHVKSRSLNNFINEYNPKYGIRFSPKNFNFKGNIINIPLYAAFCITKESLDELGNL